MGTNKFKFVPDQMYVLLLYTCIAQWQDRTTGGQVSNVTGAMMHPQFDPHTCENDVAIVKISPAVGPDLVGEFARVAKNGSYPKPGKKRAAGWGQMNPGPDFIPPLPKKKREVELTAVSFSKCLKAYRRMGYPLKQSMVCVRDRGKTQCVGDSGGPLLDAGTGELEGVASFGGDCGSHEWPGVSTAVGQVFGFISRHAG
ncbi:trypsin, partial [Metarhizium brunneum ARSEF 3297]